MSLAVRVGDAVGERETEPVAADMRPSSHKRFSDEVLRILAPIVGCGYDDLRQRSRSRRLRVVAASALAAAVAGVSFGGFALFQQAQIQRNYGDALRNQSEYLAEEAQTLLDGEDGSVLATTNETLPSISGVWESGDASRLYAPTTDGVLALCVDPESFGLESEMSLARAVSRDESRALIRDYRGVYTLPVYTTDELAAYARDLVSGHELTNAERRLHHLD